MNLHFYSILLGCLILFAGAGMVWSAARRYHRRSVGGNEERGKPEETAFIINAFHEVTKQLKEKERELERLKLLAEQRAENVESYNENILQCVTSGVMTFDRDCLLTTVNRSAVDMLHISLSDARGKSCRELFNDDIICRAVRETVEHRVPSQRLESALDRPGGKVWLGFNTAVLTDRHGEALGVILSFSDLTEVKRLQEQMELRERLTALGEMSAGIAHELRNPMAVIAGYLNLLSKKTDERSQTIIRDITAEINGMNRIIGDLLTFARPASLNRVSVSARELIEGCVANVLQATNAESRVRTLIAVEDRTLSIDEVLMRQAFSNLIQNAVEAMPDGGTISIDARGERNYSVAITDTGSGIAPEMIRKIFLPFFTTKDKGVGLGLALTHKIVLSHGGRIDVQSTEGKGTAFTVILPG